MSHERSQERGEILRGMMARVAKVTNVSLSKLGEKPQTPIEKEFGVFIDTISSDYNLDWIDSKQLTDTLGKFYLIALLHGLLISDQFKIKKHRESLEMLRENYIKQFEGHTGDSQS